jgi:hypothetical protein
LTAQLVSVSVLHLSRHRPLLTDPKVLRHYQKACHWSVTIDSAHFTTHVVISTSSDLDFHSGTTQDRSVGIATRYRLDDPGIESRWGARFSTPVHTGSEAHPASCTIRTGLLHGVKRPERGVIHPTPSSAEVKERVELYLYSLLWVFHRLF